MRRTVTILLITGLFFSVCWAEDQPPQDQKFKDQRFRESYSLGYEFGANLKWRGMEGDVDVDVLLSAVREGLEGKTPALTSEEVRETLNQLKKKVMIIQDRRFRELAAKNLKESKGFMKANKLKEGMKTLPSGLQYRVISEGNGAIPKSSDIVKVSYRGTLTDGTEFDTSHGLDGPIITSVDGMLKGWTEALQLMKEGSKWQIFVPPWLGYGERRFRRVPPNSILIYEIELLSIGGTLGPTANEPKPAADRQTQKDGNRQKETHSD